jgi:hypothetical protein
MYKKVITKECPSCKLMTINDDSEFECQFGHAKKKKILIPRKRKKEVHCKLYERV